jgi:hypothetical protein
VSYRKSFGLLAGCGIAGFVVASCGSSSGGGDNGTITHKDAGMGAIVDAGTQTQGDADASVPADGTTGKPCTTDADCNGGQGINKCSNGMVVTLIAGMQRVQFLPTPVCLMPGGNQGNCDPAPPTDPTGTFLHYCDGPDDSRSPGLCVPFDTQNPVSGQGHCEVQCSFVFDGSAPTGCIGKDTCTPAYVVTDQTGAMSGLGWCQGTCEQDSDCSALNGPGDAGTWVCQTDIGFCTQRRIVRKKQIGQACSQSARVNDLTAGNCDCSAVDPVTGNGFCTSSCIVGGSVNLCPAGWVCDNLTSNTLPDGTPITAENNDTPGQCMPVCSLGEGGAPEAGTSEGGGQDGASDGSSDASGGTSEASAPLTCPTGSTCQELTPVGATCVP